MIREVSPDRGTTTYDHDAAGRIIRIIDARGVVVTQTWDAAGRLLTRTYPTTTLTVAFTYDATANGYRGRGRLTGMTDASGSSAYTYDAKGRVIREGRVVRGVSHTVSYTYDGAGRLLSIT